MIRNFYNFAVFFTAVHLLVILFQVIIYWQLGDRVYALPSISLAFGWVYLIGLIQELIVLKYYHGKQYRVVCWLMAAFIISSFLEIVVFYKHVLLAGDITLLYTVITLTTRGVALLYAVGVVFSETGKRPWLKAAGIYLFFLWLLITVSTVWAFNSVSFRLNGISEKVELLILVCSSPVPLLFILNFLSERASAEKRGPFRSESFSTLGFGAFIAVLSTVFVGQRLIGESFRLPANGNVPEYLKEIARPFDERMYVNKRGDTLRYRLMVPQQYDSTAQYPLVVCLHGSSGRGIDNAKQMLASTPVQWLANPSNRTKYPAFLFVPQCPPYASWGGIPGVASVDSLVFEAIAALEEEFGIDTNRRYVTGNSMGGYGAWHLIGSRPEMFAAAIPISGGGNPSLAPQMVDVPVWAFHGAEDRIVPVSGSRDVVKAMKAAGGAPVYTEYRGKGHHIWENIAATPGLLDWLFAQKRE